jgi:hypothetical protein
MTKIYSTTNYNNEIDPIDRLMDSINRREEINSNFIEKTEKVDMFFNKYISIYNYYQRKYPYQDPLTKVLDEIDRTNNLIKIAEKENKDNLLGLNNKLKTLKLYSVILAKGLDSININVLFNNNSYTIMDTLTRREFYG